jgi:hypothetical protein
MRSVLIVIALCLSIAACAKGPSPEKIAAMKAEANAKCPRTPVAFAKCENEIEQRELPDPHPDLANIIYAARVDLAAKVEAKQITPEAAELEFSKIVAQVHDEERRRSSAAMANAGAAMANAGAALGSINAGAPPPPTICRPIGGGAISCQ